MNTPSTIPTSTIHTTSTPPTANPAVLGDRELAEQFGSSVLKVTAEGCGLTSTGTAFVVAPSTLVTNHHVVAMDTQPVLYTRDGRSIVADVAGWVPETDLAVLTTTAEVGLGLVWKPTSDLSEGDDLVALGYPLPAHDFTVAAGSILSFEYDGPNVVALRFDAAVDYGSSGGPALTRDGMVAGVVSAVDPNPEGLRLVPLVLPGDSAAGLVDQLLQSASPPQVDCDSVPGMVSDTAQAVAQMVSSCVEYPCDVMLPATGSEADQHPVSVPGHVPGEPPYVTNVRVFGEGEMAVPLDFPYLLNSCAGMVWTARWRTLSGDKMHGVVTDPPMDPFAPGIWNDEIRQLPQTSEAGFLAGFGCSLPAWFFDDGDPNVAIISDVVVDWQIWYPTP